MLPNEPWIGGGVAWCGQQMKHIFQATQEEYTRIFYFFVYTLYFAIETTLPVIKMHLEYNLATKFLFVA